MRNVLFYDGECGLCNAVVRFLLRRDRRGLLRFAPLQGATAQAFLRNQGLDTAHFDSLVFVDDLSAAAPIYFLRSNAVLEILRRLGGVWRFSAIFRVIPPSVRDLAYRLVARTRYLIFGVYRPRPLEKPEWAARFLE
ncbi:MAG TPA: DCC1-like thiol-disulfide oxidoreductase family protein [Opitutaceae bacterium]|nr:DCC1-like thiol-disulfide oxidoreductase family protein [Opitutaceae bacterium]